jgi:hypothetical protein
MIEMWDRCLLERWVHPLIALAVFNLDFLCILSFRDGNARVSRLLLLLQCYPLGKVKCLGRGQNAEWEKAGKWK